MIPWLARLTGHRARSDARLLLVVLAVAVVSGTMIASLALLVTTTEQGGLRSALGSQSADRTRMDVTVTDPSVPVDEVESAAASAIDFLLADTVPSRLTTIALTGLSPVAGLVGEKPALAYLGELDGVRSGATLVDGTWPDELLSGSDTVPVAIPQGAADALALAVGDALVVGGTPVELVGVYRIDEPESSYWARDRLAGGGIDRAFPLPGTRSFTPSDAFGPLVVAPQALDAAAIAVQTVDLRFQPDFGALAIADLGVISDRLSDARTRVPARVGDVGERVMFSSGLSGLVDEAASGLLVTRSTVITVGLLLLLVAIVSLAQSARLVTDSRLDERRLLRARGASLAGIRGMTAIEAVAIGLVAALASPVLAAFVYRAVAAQPAMVAAGLPGDSGLPPFVWGVAAATGLAFVAVLLAPLVRPAELFDDERGEQRAGRRIRPLGLVRLGIDIGVAALAVLLYQQLAAYRPPIGVASVRIDPLLVIAPAVLLGACSLLAVRLVPLVATVLERAGSRARGAVLSLASWEVGRRARSATAVVLLLTLAVAVGSFGSTFLSTWRQSQVDQAALAFGAPVRVPADAQGAAAQSTALADGARGDPQAVLRRFGRVAGPNAGGSDTRPPAGPGALILGISEGGRTLLDRGRVGDEGGSVIERMLRANTPAASTVALPEGSRGLTAIVRIGEPSAPFPGVAATVSAVIEAEDGLLSTVELGVVPVDGAEYSVQGILAAPAESESESGSESGASSLGLAALVVDFAVDDSGTFQLRTRATPVSVLVRNVGVLRSPAGDAASALDSTPEPLAVDAVSDWVPRARTQYETEPNVTEPPEGWELALRVRIPQDIDGRRRTYSLTGWDDLEAVPVVASARLARLMSVAPGARLTLVVAGAQIPVQLAAIGPLVPGSSSAPEVSDDDVPDGGESAATTDVIVVDQVLLSRAFITGGLVGSAVDEWWIDVDPGGGQAYLDLHGSRPEGAGAQSSEVSAAEQSDGPLRIATPAALWLVIASAVVLTVVGFAVHTAAAMRSRRTEFAQLRAIGLARRSLVAVIGAESVLLSVLGTVFGIAIGVVLGSAVAPLIGLSPDGSAPQPSVAVVVPIAIIAGLALLVALVVVGVVLVVAGRQRSADPAAILRGAGE